MTREEIIKGLNDVKETLNKLLIHRHSWMYQPIDEAIKVLEQEPCEDYISRQAAIDKMQELEDEDIKAYGCSIPEGFDGQRAIRALKSL